MADRLIDLMDLVVWRVPTPAQLDRMADLVLESRYMRALERDRQRAADQMAAEIDRRDQLRQAAPPARRAQGRSQVSR